MLKVWVDGCVDLPLHDPRWTRGCCEARPRLISVQIAEIEEPRQRGREPEACLPSVYVVPGGEQDNTGLVSFPQEARQRHAEVKLTEGWRLRFELLDERLARSEGPLAFAEIETLDLARHRSWRLLLSDPVSNEAIYGDDGVSQPEGLESQPPRGSRVRCPAFLKLRTEVVCGGPAWSPSSSSTAQATTESFSRTASPGGSEPRRKRVMMLTRGTRGDVQPFVALARGLILHRNCEVTIVTELCWKKFVKAGRLGLPERTLLFRPSGGDTMKKVGEFVPRMVMRYGQHSDGLQALILSRCEVEFFISEGCMYHWAARDEDGGLLPPERRPDLIVFSVTTVHIAMIISENLEIPIAGFMLQPRREIEPRADPQTLLHEAFAPLRQVLRGPEFNEALRQVMEKVGGRLTLNMLRKSRGLGACPRDIHTQSIALEELMRQGVGMIVPVNRLFFHSQAAELGRSGFTLTDFIFLRLGTDELDPAIESFIKEAKSVGRRIVAITFSSMPVGERRMLEIAIEISTKCMPPVDAGQDRHKVAVLVLAGGQDHEQATPQLLAEASGLEAEGRLLLWRRPAPFGALFPKVDAVVLHGGLGVTSEAALAGVPTVTSGILLLDQLFWAARTHECGCGSQGVPVSKLLARTDSGVSKIVDLVRQALDQREGAEDSWFQNAKSLQRRILETRCEEGFADDPDGIKRNAFEVYNAGVEHGVVVRDAYRDTNGCCQSCGRQGVCCVRFLLCTTRWLVCTQMWSCIYVLLRCVVCCACRPCRQALARLCPGRIRGQSVVPLLSYRSTSFSQDNQNNVNSFVASAPSV